MTDREQQTNEDKSAGMDLKVKATREDGELSVLQFFFSLEKKLIFPTWFFSYFF